MKTNICNCTNQKTKRMRNIVLPLCCICALLISACQNTTAGDECYAYRSLRKTIEASCVYALANTEIRLKHFEAAYASGSDSRALAFYTKLYDMHKYAMSAYDYIESVKQRLILKGGGFDSSLGDAKQCGSHSIAPSMLLQKQNDSSISMRIRKRIANTRAALMNAPLDTANDYSWQKLQQSFTNILRDNDVEKWEQQNFGSGLPLTGVLTALSGLQLEIVDAENAVICKWLSDVESPFCDFGNTMVAAITPRAYLTLGETYYADIFLHCAESNTPHIVLVNNKRIPVSHGIGRYVVTPAKEGVYKWSALIQVLQSDGSIKEYVAQEYTYTVVSPGK